MPEEFVLRTGFTNLLVGAETWVAVAYLAGMFLVLAFRPQQIADPSSFRRSYILFALYFIVPGSINALILLTMIGSRGPGEMQMVILQLSGITGKVLLGLSIIFALGSMIHNRISGFPFAKRPEIESERSVPLADELKRLREENVRLRKRSAEGGGREDEGIHGSEL